MPVHRWDDPGAPNKPLSTDEDVVNLYIKEEDKYTQTQTHKHTHTHKQVVIPLRNIQCSLTLYYHYTAVGRH